MLMSNMGGKLAILAVVPKALVGKLSAKAWSGKAGIEFARAKMIALRSTGVVAAVWLDL